MYERNVTITRTIFVARCDECGDETTLVDNPPKEKFCMKCKKWIKFEPVSYTGPELTK